MNEETALKIAVDVLNGIWQFNEPSPVPNIYGHDWYEVKHAVGVLRSLK